MINVDKKKIPTERCGELVFLGDRLPRRCRRKRPCEFHSPELSVKSHKNENSEPEVGGSSIKDEMLDTNKRMGGWEDFEKDTKLMQVLAEIRKEAHSEGFKEGKASVDVNGHMMDGYRAGLEEAVGYIKEHADLEAADTYRGDLYLVSTQLLDEALCDLLDNKK